MDPKEIIELKQLGIDQDTLQLLIDYRNKTQLRNKLLKHYCEIVHEIRDSAEKHSFFLDKAIITISSGAIALLFAVFKDVIISLRDALVLVLVREAIWSFCAALVFVLGSFVTIARHFVKKTKKLSDWVNGVDSRIQAIDLEKARISEDQDLILKKLMPECNFDDWWRKIAHICNILAAISISLGIVASILMFFRITSLLVSE